MRVSAHRKKEKKRWGLTLDSESQRQQQRQQIHGGVEATVPVCCGMLHEQILPRTGTRQNTTRPSSIWPLRAAAAACGFASSLAASQERLPSIGQICWLVRHYYYCTHGEWLPKMLVMPTRPGSLQIHNRQQHHAKALLVACLPFYAICVRHGLMTHS